MQTPFHAFYLAKELDSLTQDESFSSVFASSNLKIYPFQIAAANFALKSPYQKGVILCDESGMGKSHEAMLVISQKWLEGKTRILLAIPNADLLTQWTELIDSHYTIPYITLTNRQEWNGNVSLSNPNGFDQNAIIVTTYDFITEQSSAAKSIKWDLCVFEEANALSSCYLEENKSAKILKAVAEDSFKILLTGTPIEKNIMDLYGLMYFIDSSILLDELTFLQRYLRKPENYPELAERVQKYCFRTLRRQAKQYAQVPNRINLTLEITPSEKEKKVYELLFAYINKEKKIAFPEMSQYDLSLRLLGLLGSSTAAIIQTLDGIILRLQAIPNAEEEIAELQNIQAIAQSIKIDEKAKLLIKAIPKIFAILKTLGANKKALIFTESVETQKYLYGLLKDKYKTTLYNGTTNYTEIQNFKIGGEILISTDNGARGFNLEEACFIVNYDLLYNTLKMEQRIDRCHRLNQQNDVITLAFMDKSNFAEVRKLELVSKRTLVSDGVFGVSDAVVGGFTDNLDIALSELTASARTRKQIEQDYLSTLENNKSENELLVENAEDILFTTFTKTIADKVSLSPKYIEEKASVISDKLWLVVKFYFENYNQKNKDCYYEIDDTTRTITATNYSALPCLFYYWSGGQNRRYYSQKQYGMAKDFKPTHGRITLTSILARGILQEIDVADNGEIVVNKAVEPCKLALYNVELKPTCKHTPLLIGITESGKILSTEECKKLMILPYTDYSETGRRTVAWLKTSSAFDKIDNLVNIEEMVEQEKQKLTNAQKDEIERIKLKCQNIKSTLSHALNDAEFTVKKIEKELQSVSGDRMKTLNISRQLNILQQDLKRKKEQQFFEEMQQDVECEKHIDEFLGNNKVSAKAVRQFILNVKGVAR